MSLAPPSCTESAPEFVKVNLLYGSFAFVLAGDERLGFVVPVVFFFNFSPLMLAEDEGLDCGADSSVLFVWRAL